MRHFLRNGFAGWLSFAATLYAVVPLACVLLTAEQAQALRPQAPDNAQPVQLAVVTRIDCQSTSAPVRVLVGFDRPVRYHSELLHNPDRLYFDFERTRPAGNIPMNDFGPCMGLVPRVRVAEHEPGTTRVVLYLAQKVSYEVANSENPAGIAVSIRTVDGGRATSVLTAKNVKTTPELMPQTPPQISRFAPYRSTPPRDSFKVVVRPKAPAPVGSAELPDPPPRIGDLLVTMHRADDGDPEAQVALGRAHETGELGSINYRQALRWYERAAVQGNVYAALRLGGMYANGIGIERDLAQAGYWYRSVAPRSKLARLRLRELRNVDTASQRLTLAAETPASSAAWAASHPDAHSTSQRPLSANSEEQQPASTLAAVESGVRRDIPAVPSQAVSPVLPPVSQDSRSDRPPPPLSADKLLAIHRPRPDLSTSLILPELAQPSRTASPTRGTTKTTFDFDPAEAPSDPAAAAKWYLEAAQKGIAQSQYGIATRYLAGDGVTKDLGKAAMWFGRAAEQGHAAAQNNLGVLYLNGWGVPASVVEARKWFAKSAQAGDAGGQNNLGAAYIAGRGVLVNYSEGVKWLREAADQGLPEAAYSLGTLYANGRGVPRDPSVAVHWFRHAAMKGYARAQFVLGDMFLSGQGTVRDYAEARQWLERAAAQGLPEADVAMARIYRDGLGVKPSGPEAVAWLSKAAGKGYAEAQYALGQMYADGKSVPADPVLAYAWFAIAASNGQRGGLKAINSIAPTMTMNQIAEAQKQAYLLAGKIATTRSVRQHERR